MWTHASGEHLAGYEQQDAHEFLIALLDALHTDLLPGPPPAAPPSAATSGGGGGGTPGKKKGACLRAY